MTSITKLLTDLENDFSIDKYFETKNIINNKWDNSLEELTAEYDESHNDLLDEDIPISSLNKFLDLMNNNYNKFVNQINVIYKNYLNKLDKIYFNWKSKN